MDTYNNRPLSYESSKILLKYLEADTRFQLSSRVPSIRQREKLVPMNLRTLKFSPFEFLINETVYTLGTYRDYPIGVEVLSGHRNDNMEGGVPYDLDQYGFRDYSDEDVFTPGDVVIRDPLRAGLNPENEEFLERHLVVFKWILATRAGQEVEPLDENLRAQFRVFFQNPEIPEEFFHKEISKLETTLAPFRCRRERTQRPYTTSIQLTVVPPFRTRQILRKPSVDPVQNTNFKLHEAQKQLADFLFGNRADNLCVRSFEVKSDHLHKTMIVRLPQTFQVKTKNLALGTNGPATCDAIRDLVHESSYPLSKILYTCGGSLLAHPTIAGARELYFVHNNFNEIQELLLFQNHIIFMGLNRFTPDEHITLLRNWMDNRREIGASFISRIENEATIREILTQAKEHLNGVEHGERCVKIPLNNLSQIEVSYKGSGVREQILTIKVVAV